MTRFILVRHGLIDFADRIPGRLPGVHLSDAGKRQALAIARALGPLKPDLIVSSPLERCLETAAPLSRSTGCAVLKRESLIEIDFGQWTGCSFGQLEGEVEWKQFHLFRSGCRIPGGELMGSVQRRMAGEIEEFAQQWENGTVVLFSHNDPIKSLIAWVCGIPLDLFLNIRIDPGSISVFRMGNGSFEVESVNLTSVG